MRRSTVRDFLRTVRKAILAYVSLMSAIIAAFFFVAVVATDAVAFADILKWREAILAPALALIVGFFFGWGLATRLHASSLRLPILMLGAIIGAVLGLLTLVAGLHAAGMPSEAQSIVADPIVLIAFGLLFAVGGLLIAGWSYLTAEWTSWFWDFD